MVVVAIIAVISAIAIPAYNGYLTEARLGGARANTDTLRLFVEEFQLNNATYVANAANAGAGCAAAGSYTQDSGTSEIFDCFGWRPDGDGDQYTYTLATDATSWNIVVEHISGDWIRCEGRMSNCCDSETAGATKLACP